MIFAVTTARLRRSAFVLAALSGLALLSAPAAQAFTFMDQEAGTKNGSALDLSTPTSKDRIGSRLTDDNKSTVTPTGPTFQFGSGRSFNQRYNPDYMFNSNTLMGR